MFKLFVAMLSLGIILLVTAGVLYVVWDISDAVDELSGKKRLRQIEKLRKASMAIGATSVVASTTQMFRDSEEEEEIASIIQNAHNVEETSSNEAISSTNGYDEDTFGDKTGIIPEEVSEISLEENSENGILYTTSKVVFLEELTNVEV